jgi:hypothetical protein
VRRFSFLIASRFPEAAPGCSKFTLQLFFDLHCETNSLFILLPRNAYEKQLFVSKYGKDLFNTFGIYLGSEPLVGAGLQLWCVLQNRLPSIDSFLHGSSVVELEGHWHKAFSFFMEFDIPTYFISIFFFKGLTVYSGDDIF